MIIRIDCQKILTGNPCRADLRCPIPHAQGTIYNVVGRVCPILKGYPKRKSLLMQMKGPVD